MQTRTKFSAYTRFSLITLLYNFLVILWGVFLRASKSGDGCGQHWLTCHGEVIPAAPAFKTVIEFSHRISTAIAGLLVLVMLIWARRKFKFSDLPLRFATLSFVFIIFEVLIGAALVLTGNTADTWTPTRPFWMAGHLIITFGLLAVLTLNVWSVDKGALGRPKSKILLFSMVALTSGILLTGVSGSVAALSNMLHKSASLTEGLMQDFSSESPIIVRLRIFHPIISTVVAAGLVFFAGWVRRTFSTERSLLRLGVWLEIVVVIQIACGVATIFLGAPIVMQLIHLFLADLVWILFVLIAAELFLKRGSAGGSEV